MRSIRPLALLALLAVACTTAASEARHGASAPPSPAESSPSSPRSGGGEFTPPPDKVVPTDPAKLARLLAKTTSELRAAVEEWTTNGDPSKGKGPLRLRLLALYQQRIYRFLARHPDRAKWTISRLPGWVDGEARSNATAGARLFSLVHPVKPNTRFRTGPPEPANVLLRYYRQAERRFHVSWAVLAAVNYVESKFGRVLSNSSAGAQGPMQFIPSTWRAYGMGGDVHDPHDAIMGAANYLHASGAPGNYRNALYNYNHAYEYVDAVLLYAKQMLHDQRDYYEYYNWQVFIATTAGDKRLTGPGLH